MTVSDLICELQRYNGHLEVRVLLSEVIEIGEFSEHTIHPSKEDALRLDRVTFEGNHILLESI